MYRKHAYFAIVFCLLLAMQLHAASHSPVAKNIDTILSAPDLAGGFWGIEVVSLDTGKVVYAQNADKLFTPASNTKLFTATALALLVEEGKIEWDKPVTNYLPAFAMSDPYVTHELTVRDLLVHRSGLGLGAGDLLWWPPSSYSRQEVVRRIRFIPLATSFRSTYAYDNVLYLVAGQGLEATEVGDPFVVGQGVEADRSRCSVVAEPQDGLWKSLRLHRVGELRAERRIWRIGPIGARDGH